MASGEGIIDDATPESIYLAQEFAARLRASVANLGPQAVRCLEGMIARESAKETATACGTSLSSINRLRRQIRVQASKLLQEDADS
jgi:hypothetical protein